MLKKKTYVEKCGLQGSCKLFIHNFTKNNTSPQVLFQHLAIANQWDGSYTMETLPGKGLNLN